MTELQIKKKRLELYEREVEALESIADSLKVKAVDTKLNIWTFGEALACVPHAIKDLAEAVKDLAESVDRMESDQ